jgi:hypothetical protein
MSLVEPVVQQAVVPEPEFAVVSASARRHAALPAIEFDVQVSEPSGRQVYVIALSAQVMIEPARREYDTASKERLVELFGAPERWGTTTNSLVWHRADVLVPSFTGSTTFRVPVPVSYDLEVAGAKYFDAVTGGDVPLAFNFNGTIHYRGDDGRLQMSLVPWSCSADFAFPVTVWKEAIQHTYPNARWVTLHDETLRALLAEKARRGSATVDAAIAALLKDAGA